MTIQVLLCAIVLLAPGQQRKPAPTPVDPISEESLTLPVAPPGSWPSQGYLYVSAKEGWPGVEAQISVLTHGKAIRLRWLFAAGTESGMSDQRFDTPFWPTAAAAFGDQLIVAGKRRNLKTCIELWTFEHAAAPAPGGEYEASVTKEVLFDAHVVGKRRVRFLEPIRSPAGTSSMLVHFGDSNDVYAFRVETREFTLVRSAQQEPLLGNHYYLGLYCIDHPTLGYLYVYVLDPAGPSEAKVFLQDGDRDGVLEGSIAVETFAEGEQLLGDPSTWLGVYDG